jgi:hypothetical protein
VTHFCKNSSSTTEEMSRSGLPIPMRMPSDAIGSGKWELYGGAEERKERKDLGYQMQISSMGSAVGKVYSCCGEVCGSQSHQPIGPPVQLGECASAPNFQVLIGFSTLFYSLGVFFFFFFFKKIKNLYSLKLPLNYQCLFKLIIVSISSLKLLKNVNVL